MTTLELLNAPHMGIRELRSNLSHVINRRDIVVATQRGKPAEVLMPYAKLLSLLTLLGDLSDRRMTEVVAQGRRAISLGAKGIAARPAETSDLGYLETEPRVAELLLREIPGIGWGVLIESMPRIVGQRGSLPLSSVRKLGEYLIMTEKSIFSSISSP